MAINITSNNVDSRSIVSTLLSDNPQRLKSDKIIANFPHIPRRVGRL